MQFGYVAGCPYTCIGGPLRRKTGQGMGREEGWAAGQGPGASSPQLPVLQSEPQGV